MPSVEDDMRRLDIIERKGMHILPYQAKVLAGGEPWLFLPCHFLWEEASLFEQNAAENSVAEANAFENKRLKASLVQGNATRVKTLYIDQSGYEKVDISRGIRASFCIDVMEELYRGMYDAAFCYLFPEDYRTDWDVVYYNRRKESIRLAFEPSTSYVQPDVKCDAHMWQEALRDRLIFLLEAALPYVPRAEYGDLEEAKRILQDERENAARKVGKLVLLRKTLRRMECRKI